MMNKRKKLLFSLLVLLLLGVGYYFFLYDNVSIKKVKYVAVVGVLSKPDPKTGELKPNPVHICFEKSIKYYLKQFSKRYKGYRLKVKSFDNQGSPENSQAIYKEKIVPDEDIVCVIDFSYGSNFRSCADIIKNKGIPVITINPDHNNLDYGKNVLFVYNDDEMPRDVSSFLKKARNIQKIDFISESDYPPHSAYISEMEKLDISIDNMVTFEGEVLKTTGNYTEIFAQLDSLYGSKDSNEVVDIVMNTHNAPGDKILRYLDEKYKNLHIHGPVFITTLGEGSGFGVGTGNEIFIIDKPMDAISKQMTKDLLKLRKKEPETFGMEKAPLFIKRGYDAVSIINNVVMNRVDSIPVTRELFKEFMNDCPENTIVGWDDIYKFDENNTAYKELTFTHLRNNKVVSYSKQMNVDREVIPNLFFGMEVQDIFDLNVSENSFSADFYYWVKMDTADRGTENVISFQNMKQSESTIDMVREEIEGDVLYQLYRVSGKFFVEYKLRDFPLDMQEIDIIVEMVQPVDQVKISFDKTSFEQDTAILERFKVPGWDKIGYFITVNNNITRSLRGDPKYSSGDYKKFKTFTFSLDVKRNFLSGFLEIILPLAMISFISIGLLYTSDLTFATMGEVSVGTFLGIIAFSISLSDSTPSSGELTKADLLFWWSFAINFICFMVIIVLNSIYQPSELKHNSHIRKLRTVLIALYPVVVVAVLLLW